MASLLSTPLPATPVFAPARNPLYLFPARTSILTPPPRKSLSPLRVAAPPTQQQPPSQDQVEIQDSEENSPSKFTWRDHWYPVSLIEDLNPGVPTHFQLLNRDLVLWFDPKQSQWAAFDDKCPHRLAPLSEGRIDENGHLQCSYHGWSFDGCGSCTRIPQASPEGPEARAVRSPRACATRFPTMVSQGLLFVWPDENGWERAQATKPPELPDDFKNPEFSTVTIQRDLFYGYDTLMENVSDPSHIDFAHHKVTGRRDRAKPLPFKMESTGHWGFSGANDGNPKISAEFIAPCYYINKIEIDTKLPIVGDQKWVIWICSFNVPMAPGKTRSIVCSARNFFQFTMPGLAWWQVVPRWHEHWTSNKVYDGDMIVLQGQEKVFQSKSKEGGADVNKEYTKITFTPTQADRLVLAFRNWLRRHGNSQPEWFGSADQQPLPSIVLSKRQMDKASIVGDASLYLQDLQTQAKKLRSKIAGLESSLEGREKNQQGIVSSQKKTPFTSTNYPICKNIFQVDMFQVGERGFYGRVECNRGQGVAPLLYKALESLTRLNVSSSNLGTLAERFILTFNLKMLDRYEQHTLKCSSCRNAYTTFQTLEKLLIGSAVVAATAGIPANMQLRIILGGVAIVSAALAYTFHELEKNFVFVDYVHTEIE